MMKAELEQAMFTVGAETKSVWDWADFKMTIYGNAGNVPRELACLQIKQAFDDLNAHYGKNYVNDI